MKRKYKVYLLIISQKEWKNKPPELSGEFNSVQIQTQGTTINDFPLIQAIND